MADELIKDIGAEINTGIKLAEDAITSQQAATTAYGERIKAVNVQAANEFEMLARRSDEAYTSFDQTYRNLEKANKVPDGLAKIMAFLGKEEYNKNLQLVKLQASSAQLKNIEDKMAIAARKQALGKESAVLDLNVAGENTKAALARLDLTSKKLETVGQLVGLDTAKLNNRVAKINTDIAELKTFTDTQLQTEISRGSQSRFGPGLLENELRTRQSARLQLEKLASDTRLALLDNDINYARKKSEQVVDVLVKGGTTMMRPLLDIMQNDEDGVVYYGLSKTPDKDGNKRGMFLPTPSGDYDMVFTITRKELADAWPKALEQDKVLAQEMVRQQGILIDYAEQADAGRQTIDALTAPGFVGAGSVSPDVVKLLNTQKRVESSLNALVDAQSKGLNPTLYETQFQTSVQQLNEQRVKAVDEALKSVEEKQQKGFREYLENNQRIVDAGTAQELLINSPGNSANMFQSAMQILQEKVGAATTQGGIAIASGTRQTGASIVDTSKVSPQVAIQKVLSDPAVRAAMDGEIVGELQSRYFQNILDRMALDHPAMAYLLDIVGKNADGSPRTQLKSSITGLDGKPVIIRDDNGEIQQNGLIKAMAVAEAQYAGRLEAARIAGTPLPPMGKNQLVDTFVSTYNDPSMATKIVSQELRFMNPQDAALYRVIHNNNALPKLMAFGRVLEVDGAKAKAEVKAIQDRIQTDITREQKDLQVLQNTVNRSKELGLGQKQLEREITERQMKIQNMFQLLTGPQ